MITTEFILRGNEEGKKSNSEVIGPRIWVWMIFLLLLICLHSGKFYENKQAELKNGKKTGPSQEDCQLGANLGYIVRLCLQRYIKNKMGEWYNERNFIESLGDVSAGEVTHLENP